MKSLSLLVAVCLLAAPAGAQETKESQAAMTPVAALERLKEGNARFVANTLKSRDWSAKVAATAAGQYPFAAVLGCMDSRAPIEILFDQGVGDVFGVRVAGNVVNDDELGSLEYAVLVGTKLIVVLGHTKCGAVKGAIEGVELGHLSGLLAKIQPAEDGASCRDPKQDACVNEVARRNVLQSMAQIRARSAYIKRALDEDKVDLVGGMYDVSTGKVSFFEK